MFIKYKVNFLLFQEFAKKFKIRAFMLNKQPSSRLTKLLTSVILHVLRGTQFDFRSLPFGHSVSNNSSFFA